MSENERTSKWFLPKKYDLYISIEREARAFHGNVNITGQSFLINEIVFDSHELQIESVSVDGDILTFNVDEDRLIISGSIYKGNHEIEIKYSGNITDAMHGMYPCYYNVDGKKAELVATQFESHYAREVFPCIDDPLAKAIFNVTIESETDVTVLGNMPIKKQLSDKDRLITYFAETPKMSSYLLAWVIGKLQKKTGCTKNGVEVNVWSTLAHLIESLDFSLDIAIKSIEFYENYFGVKYPLPKSDHVALPDFSAGAMENWGLITYREVALLSEPGITSISSKHYIATVVAHELAHQWFGNLVTMKWWNDLWLNESFASLMEYICIDYLHPEWNIWLNFSSYESIVSLNRDAIDGVQPVRISVNSPEEIDTLFDGAIVYAKGAKLLKMIYAYIGEDNFRKGLKNYFIDNSYSNTEASDLWGELESVCNEKISKIMDPWLNQSGYPIIGLTYTNFQLSIDQKQFFIGPHSESEKIWPVIFSPNDITIPKLFIDKNCSIKYTKTDKPLILNCNDNSHFITNYDDSLLKQLLESIKSLSISPIDRLGVLHEQSLLAQSGIKSYSELLPMLLSYINEPNEFVWDIISLTLNGFKKFVDEDEKSELRLKSFYRMMAIKQYDRLGWVKTSHESDNDTKLRPLIIGMMLYSDDSLAIAKALEIYESHKESIETIDSELRAVILCAAVRKGSIQGIVNDLVNAYKKISSVELKHDLAAAITSTKNVDSIKYILSNFKNTDTIKPQDVTSWYVYSLRNKYSRDLTWQWLTNNWEWIEDNFKSDMSYDDFPKYTAGALTTQDYLNKYTAFFSPMMGDKALARSISVGINEIQSKISLIQRDRDAVCKKLESYDNIFSGL